MLPCATTAVNPSRSLSAFSSGGVQTAARQQEIKALAQFSDSNLIASGTKIGLMRMIFFFIIVIKLPKQNRHSCCSQDQNTDQDKGERKNPS